MFITVDTSILIAVLTHEPVRARALELTSGQNLIAPSSIHWAIGNAFSAMIKRGRATLVQANLCLEGYAKVPIKLVDVSLSQTMALVEQHRIYAYDAYFLVCAMQSRSPLLSLDQSLNNVAKGLGVQIMEIS